MMRRLEAWRTAGLVPLLSLAACVVMAGALWAIFGPPAWAADELPPLPAKVGVRGPGAGGVVSGPLDRAGVAALARMDGPPEPLPLTAEQAAKEIVAVLDRTAPMSYPERVAMLDAVRAKLRVGLRGKVDGWITQGDTARPNPVVETFDLAGRQ